MKKIISILIAVVMLIASVICFSGCGKIGDLYFLKEAYENGFLTKSDLESIAYYSNNCVIQPTIEYPKPLSKKIEKEIKKAAEKYYKSKYPDVVAEHFSILRYYGEYNGCYAVIISYPGDIFAVYIPPYSENIGGIEILQERYYEIRIYKSEKE